MVMVRSLQIKTINIKMHCLDCYCLSLDNYLFVYGGTSDAQQSTMWPDSFYTEQSICWIQTIYKYDIFGSKKGNSGKNP